MRTFYYHVHMKGRITLTIDPAIVRRAKKIALERKTSVSALVEGLLRGAPIDSEPKKSFSKTWAGKFKITKSKAYDPRLAALKKKYDLPEE